MLKTFNDLLGNIAWEDKGQVMKRIAEEIPAKVAADPAYQAARKNSDRANARVELDKALWRVMTGSVRDETELFKRFSDDPGFRKYVFDIVFDQTYE